MLCSFFIFMVISSVFCGKNRNPRAVIDEDYELLWDVLRINPIRCVGKNYARCYKKVITGKYAIEEKLDPITGVLRKCIVSYNI